MSVAPHLEHFTVYSFQEDGNGLLRPQNLCEYLQEAAGRHAALLGVSIERLQAEGLSWVLARLRLELGDLPPVSSPFTVETWPVAVEGLQFRRDFIARDSLGRIFARASSQWVIVSLTTRKIVRIPAFVSGIALDSTTTALEDRRVRLREIPAGSEACGFTARLADIDRNRHVNNTRYIEWLQESVPENIRATARLAELDLAFRAESYMGERIFVRTVPDAGESLDSGKLFWHSIIRERDTRELVRARSIWI